MPAKPPTIPLQPSVHHLYTHAHTSTVAITLPKYCTTAGLQAFMESGRARAAFHPMPLPQMRLSVENQCRVRDRSTIMARHMYADRGDAFADEQVTRKGIAQS